MARVGIREVATLAEVSLGTVSHYINHPSRVSAEKRDRIQKAIDQLGFVRNNAAWQLRSEHEIGALAPGLCADFAVLDVDPRIASSEELAEARVLATAVNGVLD